MGEPFLPEHRAHLRDWLRTEGFLAGTDAVPLRGVDGRRRAWTFYSWAVSATGPGARLMGRALLAELEDFGGTRLASFGAAGAPLVAACVVLGDGYSSLTVRRQAKRHGPGWLVEGRRGGGTKVVVVDDSLSSGHSFLTAAASLEREGFEVEGLVALVEFPGRGGRERAEALGYRVRTVFDIWTDLRAPGPPPPPPDHGIVPVWSDRSVPDGLHPAGVVRAVLASLADTGTVPRPPTRMAEPVDGRGGVFVSLRRREDDHRLVRGGFWCFDPVPTPAGRELVLATVATARRLPTPLTTEVLDEIKIAVTFLGPLEEIEPADLDFDRYGIVVRSLAWSAKLGGALPNTQYFTSSMEQYRHARSTNAGIGDIEPHQLFRHDVVKYVEPGRSWPAYGVDATTTDGWTTQPHLGDRLLARVRRVLGTTESDHGPLPDDLVPVPIDAVTVTLYSRTAPHTVIGHGSSSASSLDTAVVDAGAAAARSAAPGADVSAATVCASVLHDREPLGTTDVSIKLRRGRDAFSLRAGGRGGLVSEFAVAHHDWTREQAAAALRRMTGVAEPDAQWATYKTSTWMARPEGPVHRLAFGYPVREGALTVADVDLIAEHLRGRLDEDGWPAYGLDPRTGVRHRQGTAARCIHALRVLDDAGRLCGRPAWRADAARGLRHALAHLDLARGRLAVPHHQDSAMAVACLLAGLAGHGAPDPATDALAAHVAAWVRPDGSVRSAGMTPTRSEPDFLPGAAVLGLARHRRAGGTVDIDTAAVVAFYRRRFRHLGSWGLAAWHAQAWVEWIRLGADADEELAAFVFELADWMVDRQLRVDGSYLVDLGARVPGVLTGFVAEGVGAAWRLAEALGDEARADRYARSWAAAMGFLDRLTVRAEDTFWMADPAAALGGVRAGLATAELRVDYTSHTLCALLRGVDPEIVREA